MRLLDTLIHKRDHHLALAQKFADLIAVVQGDEDFAKHTHDRKLAIMDQAMTLAKQNGNGHTTKRYHTNQSPERRARQGEIMRERWKKHRAKMLRASKLSAKARKAKHLAAKRAALTADATT